MARDWVSFSYQKCRGFFLILIWVSSRLVSLEQREMIEWQCQIRRALKIAAIVIVIENSIELRVFGCHQQREMTEWQCQMHTALKIATIMIIIENSVELRVFASCVLYFEIWEWSLKIFLTLRKYFISLLTKCFSSYKTCVLFLLQNFLL